MKYKIKHIFSIHFLFKYFLSSLFGLIIVLGFILGVIGSYSLDNDISYLNLGLSITDFWSAYSGISIPLTFGLFLIKKNSQIEERKKLNKMKLYSIIDMFINIIELNLEHLRISLGLDLTYLTNAQDLKNDILKNIIKNIYVIDKLAPNDTNDNRKNYIMRYKLLEIITNIQELNGVEKQVLPELLHINNIQNGDEELDTENKTLYETQLEFFKTFNIEEKNRFFLEVKKILEI